MATIGGGLYSDLTWGRSGFGFTLLPDAQYFTITARYTIIGAGPRVVAKVRRFFFDTSGSFTSFFDDPTPVPHDGLDHDYTYPVPPGTGGVTIEGVWPGSSTDSLGLGGAVYCSASNVALTGCCPPDPGIVSAIARLTDLVTLLQRQLMPFAYIVKATHTGLSGDGVLSVQGLLGISVEVTTLPARAGRVLGDPLQLFDVGWVNIGTADGFGPRQFISSDPFLVQGIAAYVTQVGYSIPADVTVTIRELAREP